MDPSQARLERRTLRRFELALGEPHLVTRVLTFVLVLLHLATGVVDAQTGRGDVWGVVFGARSAETLSAFGGRVSALVRHGEVWRLWTYGFLHADAIHILFNGTALWGLGRVCEAVYGGTRTLWFFLLAVLGGGVLSQLGGTPSAVGASGGIFGLMGALLVFGLRHGRSLPPELRVAFTRQLWPWVLLNLFIGVVLPFIDNLGHVGGLLLGAGVAAMSGNQLTANADMSALTRRLMRVGSAAMLVAGFLGVVWP